MSSIFDTISRFFGGGPRTGAPFQRVLTQNDFFVSSTVPVQAGARTLIGNFQVPPQTIFRYGYGTPLAYQNQGYIYSLLKNNATTPAVLNGFLTLAVADANMWNIVNILRQRTEVLSADIADKNKKVPLPEQGPFASAYMRLLIYFESDTTDTVSQANSTLLIPTTVYPINPLGG